MVRGPRDWATLASVESALELPWELGPWREVLSGLDPQRRCTLCWGLPAALGSEEQYSDLSLPPAFWCPPTASHWPRPTGSLLAGNLDHGEGWGMGLRAPPRHSGPLDYMNSKLRFRCNKQKLVVVSSFICVRLFVTLWAVARQPSLSFTISWSLLRFLSIELVMLSNHLVLFCLLLLLSSIFPSIRVFSNKSSLR